MKEFVQNLRMSAKCNAGSDNDVISAVLLAHSMRTFFLFLTFSIISLHRGAAEPAFFARIRRFGWPEQRFERDSAKNMSEFGQNMTEFGRSNGRK
jgi:hypothetical protein